MSGPGFIKHEAPLVCSDCGQLKEVRPYGKDGALVCLECAKKDMKNMKLQADAFLFGEVPEGELSELQELFTGMPPDLSDGLGTHDRKE